MTDGIGGSSTAGINGAPAANPFLGGGSFGSSSGQRPFLTGNAIPQFTGMFGGTSSEASRPETATPNSLVDPSNPNSPTWAELPAHLQANDRPAYVQLMKSVKAAGYSSWDAALDGASRTSLPVFDFLDQAVEANAPYYKGGGGGGGAGGPFSNKQTSVSLSSESSAAQIADQVWQAELGRQARPDEIAAFQKALNAAQQANPSTTVTTGNTSGRNTVQTSTTNTGFDPTRFATDFAQSMPDYAENFAATTFMDLLDKAISKPDALSTAIGASGG